MRNILDGLPPIILFIIPLRRIVQEQVRSNEFELKAVELTLQQDVFKNVREVNVEVLYASAENVLKQQFLSIVRARSQFSIRTTF